jgi:hypothetical protein
MADVIRSAVIEVERLEEDVLYTEKAHFAGGAGLQKVHTYLGVFATVSAAASVATIVAESTAWVPGTLALGASVSSAILTFVKPEERATQHLQAGRALGALRVRMRQFRTIDLIGDITPTEARKYVTSLTKEKAKIDESAPAISNRAFKEGKKAIDQGRFDHLADA